MKVRYTFDDGLYVAAEMDLDPEDEREVLNAKTVDERKAILDPLIAAHARSEPQATLGTHKRDLAFGLVDDRPGEGD